MDPSGNVVTSPTLRFTSGSTRLPTAHVVSPVSHIYPLGQGFQHPHHLLHWCCRHLQTSLNEPPFNRKKAITTYMAGCKTHLQLQALLIPMPYLRRYKVSGMMPDILGQFVRYSYSSLFIHRGITNVKFLQYPPQRLLLEPLYYLSWHQHLLMFMNVKENQQFVTCMWQQLIRSIIRCWGACAKQSDILNP